MSKFVCKHPWTHFEVNNPNGNVTMCCNNSTVLGNVNDASLEEIWNGDGFRAARKRMLEEGALAMCPHTCPVLNGGKKYENIDWYDELSEDGEVRANAELNEEEFEASKLELKSWPRWLRFTYSYACNLDCYHCYQREDATQRLKLPDSFMERVDEYASRAQVVYPFGGEPFFFKPVVDFLQNYNTNRENRFYFITNATILTPRIEEVLSRMPIVAISASLDAGTKESFETLRLRGRKGSWDEVMVNLEKLSALHRTKGFPMTLSMTLNSVNATEIETFVDLALGFDAEPLVMLVTNPFQTREFHEKFLIFTEDQLDEMEGQINRSLAKVRKVGFEDAEVHLKQLRKALRYHRDSANTVSQFRLKQAARMAFHALPEQLQIPVRTAVNKVRARRFESYDEPGDD
jgi:MoaA/NifB/PqqE/SkfB family radical SAM enzyme